MARPQPVCLTPVHGQELHAAMLLSMVKLAGLLAHAFLLQTLR